MATCTACGSEAEYVSLVKVEGCSNPGCRFYTKPSGGFPAGQTTSLQGREMPMAIDPATGAAVVHTNAVASFGRKRLITIPDPVLRAAGPGKNCTHCWAFTGVGCKKYKREVHGAHICDNFELRPQDPFRSVSPLIPETLMERFNADLIAKLAVPKRFLEGMIPSSNAALAALQLHEKNFRLHVGRSSSRKHMAFDKDVALNYRAQVNVELSLKEGAAASNHNSNFMLTPEDTVWVSPRICFAVEKDTRLFEHGERRQRVVLVAKWAGVESNIKAHKIFGFADPQLRGVIDIHQPMPATGGSDEGGSRLPPSKG